jgi:hypothetical protein
VIGLALGSMVERGREMVDESEKGSDGSELGRRAELRTGRHDAHTSGFIRAH